MVAKPKTRVLYSSPYLDNRERMMVMFSDMTGVVSENRTDGIIVRIEFADRILTTRSAVGFVGITYYQILTTDVK